MSVAYPFAVGVSYIVMLGVCGYYFRKGLISDTFIVEGWRGDFFLAGAGLYVGTYFLGANWIYRLVFLIFLVPQLFVWLEEACPQKTLAVWTLTLITVCFWSMCINDSPWAMLPKQALFISLCGLLAYLAGVALPQRLRNGVS